MSATFAVPGEAEGFGSNGRRARPTAISKLAAIARPVAQRAVVHHPVWSPLFDCAGATCATTRSAKSSLASGSMQGRGPAGECVVYDRQLSATRACDQVIVECRIGINRLAIIQQLLQPRFEILTSHRCSHSLVVEARYFSDSLPRHGGGADRLPLAWRDGPRS